jgi:Ca2+-binding EF-hand superfamily protein
MSRIGTAASTQQQLNTLVHKKIRSAFDTFDQKNNESVDIREIGTILRSLGICPTLEQLHQWVTEMEEEEPTGYVTWIKFSKVAFAILNGKYPKRADEESLYQAFRTLDAEKKGFLVPDDLKKYMVTQGEVFTAEEIDEMLTVLVN